MKERKIVVKIDDEKTTSFLYEYDEEKDHRLTFHFDLTSEGTVFFDGVEVQYEKD